MSGIRRAITSYSIHYTKLCFGNLSAARYK
ncbi:truncated pA104R [Recombinant African swine fever virus]|nr:truncated pA104R [Recombinant African swine fever virus]